MRAWFANALSIALSCSMTLCLAMPTPSVAAEDGGSELVAQSEAVILGEEASAEDGAPAAEGTTSDKSAGDAVVLDQEPTPEADPVELGDAGDAAPAAEEAAGDADAEAEAEQVAEEKVGDEESSKRSTTQSTSADTAEKKDEPVLTAQSSSSQANTFAAKHANTIPNGSYALASMTNDAKVLDVAHASTAEGAALTIWNSKNVSNQRWQITNVSGGYVTIKSECSDKFLQAGYRGKSDVVVQATRNGSNRGQLWIACAEGRSYKLVPATDINAALCISGSTIKLAHAPSASASSAHWKLRYTEYILDRLAKTHKSDLPNGTYVFKNNANTSLYMETTDYSMDNSSFVKVGAKNGLTDQGWIVTHDSKGYVVLVNARSGRALDVRGRIAASGTQIIQWTKKQGFPRNQRWVAIKRSDGSYSLVSALLGDTLACAPTSAAKGASVKLTAYGSAGIQRWRIEKEPTHFAQVKDVTDGHYVLRTSLDINKTLDVVGNSVSDNALVKLWTLKNSDNQIWLITHDMHGYLYLRSKHSGLYLAYRNGKLCQSRVATSWVFEQGSGDYFYVRDVATGKYLDVRRSNTNNNTNQIILYGKGSGKNQQWQLSSPTIGKDTTIMGKAMVPQAAALRYLKKILGNRSVKTPGQTADSLVKLYYEEGAAEGVRADIALAQAIHETNVFQFGGDVSPKQFNFAGLGATGGGEEGCWFTSARIGVRAQIQHLKAYASSLPLNLYCVDPRFKYVTRGRAVTIAGLTNTWAIDSSYANSLVARLNAMMKS